MAGIEDEIAAKKAELDRLRPLSPGGLRNLEHVYDLELTYTSNAIEGNTLTAAETALVVEKGITIGGKPLKDHLEAIDHYDAIRYVRELARQQNSADRNGCAQPGQPRCQAFASADRRRYADQGRFVLTDTGPHNFPPPAQIPALMGDFAAWLAAISDTPPSAFTAHRRLGDIHPFDDGNGRTARLLMNLILIRGGYPPVAVRPQDRPAYVHALLQQARTEAGAQDFDRLLHGRLNAALDMYFAALSEALGAPDRNLGSR